MVTFKELLAVSGIDPFQVIMLRHSASGRRVSPYELWLSNDGSFDRFQSTQDPRFGKLFSKPVWASFVSNQENETLFVGLYESTKGNTLDIDWLCPIAGLRPGEHKGRIDSDLYQLSPMVELKQYRGELKIDWGSGNLAWRRYALGNECPIIGVVDLQSVTKFDVSPEDNISWQTQRVAERNSGIASKVLAENARANGSHLVCEACDFRHSDRAMFDVHHSHPLLAGPRMTQSTDLIVPCPVCHRRAHRSDNRMLPYNLIEFDLPLIFHPAATRVAAVVTPYGAG